MASANTPGRKKRENHANYFKVGVQGRKTGVTLRDTGVRDEYGMEPVEGIFSSPMRSPAKTAQRKADSTIVTSESMDMVQKPLNKLTGSAVGPTEILTGRRRTQEAKGVPLPPKGRSPIKTALGSSPRRQSGITSATARRHTSRTPDRPSSQSLVNRRLDFKSSGQRQSFKGMEDQEDELEAEPPISSPAQRTIRIPRPERPDVFDLRPSSVEEDDEDYSQVHDASHDAAEPQLVDEQNSLLINGVSDEYASNADADGSLQLLDDQADATIPASRHKRLSQATPSQNVKGDEGRRRGRPRKSNPESSLLQPDSNSKSASTGRSRGMVNGVVAKNAQSKQSSNKNGTMKNTSNGENMPKSSKLLKGNTVLPESSEVLYDQGENEGMDDSALERDDTTGMHVDESLSQHSNDGSRSKKRLHDDVDDSASQKKRKRQSLPPPAQRDPKAKVSGVKGKNASKANRQEQRKYRADEVPTRPKSSHVIRQGTPMDEPGAHVTRYGRASFKPLAWYRGEGVRWSQRSSRDELPGVQEIVRVEDTLPLPVKRPKKRGRKRKGSVMSTVDEVEEEPEDWEKNDGFLMGTALGWDSIEDDVTNEDVDFYVAFAEKAMRTREVPGADFRLAKCLTLDFFGAGIVELPPMSIKNSKNTRRMQMVFFIHTGKVHVEVANREFNINKGGIWQVPRGNWYSIENIGDCVAKIFFAQGNEIVAGDLGGSM